MAVPQSMDRKTFLANLHQSGLVSADQLQTVLTRLPETNRGRVVARALVELGVLTKFQAEMLLAGRTSGFVLGQYRILEQLGSGGMGRVFKAEHQTMNRIVALKLLAPQLTKTEKARQMFQREVRAAARLIHPHIVTAYDANQIGDRHYLVMEFIDGPNLEQLVRQQGPLPVGQACEFIRQAALGLQYAHEQGMVHRDIKPTNLLLQRTSPSGTARCVVKILDFGLARLHTPGQGAPAGQDSIMTGANTVMGTPDFLSPEQSRDLHQVDIRSDLYSLGCTFYFLLTGQVPFPTGTMLEKLLKHNTDEAAAIDQFRPDVPAAVAAIVRRLMAKTPAERFPTPIELADALLPLADESAGSWVPVHPPRWLDESYAEASAGAGDVTDAGGDSALVGTIPPAQSATPLSAERIPSVLLRQTVEREQRRRLIYAFLLAGGILSGLLVLIAMLAFLPMLFK